MRDNAIMVPGHEVGGASLVSTRRCAHRSRGCLLVLAILAAACSDENGGGVPLPPRPVSIRIDGPTQVTPPDQAQFTAFQGWSDGSTINVTATAQWVSTNPSVLSINAGLATALAAGEVGLTVSFEQLPSQRRTVLVIPAMPEWNGTYSLTIGGGTCSGSMPPELRQRTLTAIVVQNGLTLNVDVPNAGGFVGRIFNPEARFSVGSSGLRGLRRSLNRVDAPSVIRVSSRFSGTLDRGVTANEPRFDLSHYRRVAYSGPVGAPSLVEVLPDGNRLSIIGQAVTAMSASGFTGTLNGGLTLSQRDTGSVLAVCSSSAHGFTLTRK